MTRDARIRLWWHQSTWHRPRRPGDRNGATMGTTWHIVRVSLAAAAESSERLTAYPGQALCGLVLDHIDYARLRQRLPTSGPLGGRIRACRTCTRRWHQGVLRHDVGDPRQDVSPLGLAAV